jgi:Recombination endonuclease VII
MAKTPEQKRDAAKDARLKKFFRTSLEEYRAIEGWQANSRGSILLGTTRRGLDHNHTTGLIRGVLDWRINRALGIIENSFREASPKVLRELANYLEMPPATFVVGERYGLVGQAKNKKVMVYGSRNGPLPAIKNKKRKKKVARKPKKRVVDMSGAANGPIGNTD